MTSFRFAALAVTLTAGAALSVPSAAQAQAVAGASQTSTAKDQTPPAAPAQQSPATQQPAAPTAAPPQAGFQDGFFIQSANGDNRLALGMVAQTDGRFSLDDPRPIINTFTIRKIRPTFTGQVAKYFTFKVMPDFGNGTTIVQDAYFDVRFSPKLRVRTGKDKTPVGYELLEGDAFLLFPERALASSLVPNRDIGVQVQGDLSPTIFYAAGIVNGIPDGTSSSTELDTNNTKDLAARVVVQPFRSTKTPAGALNGFGFQVGGSHGRQIGALPSFKTSVQQTYFSYATGVTADGVRSRVSPAVFYYYKALGAFAEYMRSKQPVAKSGVTTDVDNHAWEVTGSYVLTGEGASYSGVRPKSNFDPANGHWGALQVLGRYTQLTVDQAAFDAGLAAASANREAKSFTIAANWYPSATIKIYATFERTKFFGGSAARPVENVILYRTQLGF
jgi:phosphate-selective porin OprO/OprP